MLPSPPQFPRPSLSEPPLDPASLSTAAQEASSAALRFDMKHVEKVKNDKLVNSEIDLRFPSQALANPQHLGVFIQTSIQRWSDTLIGRVSDDFY